MKKQNNDNEDIYTLNGKKVMLALLENEDYEALKTGEVVDNNGLRSPKGNYWPRQPKYIDIPHEIAAEIEKRATSSSYIPTIPETIYTPAEVLCPVPTVCNEPSEQIGREMRSFLFRNVIAPIGSHIWYQYALPWLEDKCGDWFCSLIGYRKQLPVPVYAPVIDSKEVQQDGKQNSAEALYEGGKVVRFSA